MILTGLTQGDVMPGWDITLPKLERCGRPKLSLFWEGRIVTREQWLFSLFSGFDVGISEWCNAPLFGLVLCYDPFLSNLFALLMPLALLSLLRPSSKGSLHAQQL